MQEKIVNRKELASIFGVKVRQISNYVKDGMPIYSTGLRKAQIFDVLQCKEWRDKKIDKSMSIKTQSLRDEDKKENKNEKNESQKNDLERKLKADADKAEEDAVLAKLKREKEEGSLISSKDLDVAQAEQATVYKTNYMNDKKLLPMQLFGKTKDEMRIYLDTHYSKRMEDLEKLMRKEFKSKESMYEIIEEILKQLAKGTEPKSLIKRINGSLI